MAETFNFNYFQIPPTGVQEPELVASGVARTDVNISIRRPLDMKVSNFGALGVGSRISTDYTRTNTMAFPAKGNSEDWAILSQDTGIGQNVAGRSVTVVHNPYLLGSTVKFVRDDQFIRMTMDRNTGSAITAGGANLPKADVMDTKEASATGIIATANATIKNWPGEGWRTFGGKYDFLPYSGGTFK